MRAWLLSIGTFLRVKGDGINNYARAKCVNFVNSGQATAYGYFMYNSLLNLFFLNLAHFFAQHRACIGKA